MEINPKILIDQGLDKISIVVDHEMTVLTISKNDFHYRERILHEDMGHANFDANYDYAFNFKLHQSVRNLEKEMVNWRGEG